MAAENAAAEFQAATKPSVGTCAAHDNPSAGQPNLKNMSVTKKHGSRQPSSKTSSRSKNRQLVTVLQERVDRAGYHIEPLVCRQNHLWYQRLQKTLQRRNARSNISDKDSHPAGRGSCCLCPPCRADGTLSGLASKYFSGSVRATACTTVRGRSVRRYCTQFSVICCPPCGRRWWTLQPHELPGRLPRERGAANAAAASKAGGTNHAVADGGEVAGRRHGLGCGIGAGNSATDWPTRCMVTDLCQPMQVATVQKHPAATMQRNSLKQLRPPCRSNKSRQAIL